jgi:hypothetical protein
MLVKPPELRQRETDEDEQDTDDLDELLHHERLLAKSSASSLLAGYGAHSSSGDGDPSRPHPRV